jgi:hypothetical protein
MDNMSFDMTIQVVQQHKFNLTKVLDKHKLLPKRKARMNIPLCRMIFMFVIGLAFNINVLKMKQAFSIRYH